MGPNTDPHKVFGRLGFFYGLFSGAFELLLLATPGGVILACEAVFSSRHLMFVAAGIFLSGVSCPNWFVYLLNWLLNKIKIQHSGMSCWYLGSMDDISPLYFCR